MVGRCSQESLPWNSSQLAHKTSLAPPRPSRRNLRSHVRQARLKESRPDGFFIQVHPIHIYPIEAGIAQNGEAASIQKATSVGVSLEPRVTPNHVFCTASKISANVGLCSSGLAKTTSHAAWRSASVLVITRWGLSTTIAAHAYQLIVACFNFSLHLSPPRHP